MTRGEEIERERGWKGKRFEEIFKERKREKKDRERVEH